MMVQGAKAARRSMFVLGLACSITLMGARRAEAVDGPALADAGWDAAADAAAPSGPDHTKATQVHALLGGTLDVAIAPGSLFDVPLDDPEKTALDAARVRAFLRGAGQAPDAGARGRDAGHDAGVAVDVAAWRGLLELERARVAFYDLSPEQRHAILQNHAERVANAQPKETPEERRIREAEEERKRAVDAAERAKSEAERLVAEELARLLGVAQALAATDRKLAADDAAIASRKDAVLGWQRRVRETRAAAPGEADATYDALRAALRKTRDDLDAGLSRLDAESNVVELGPDPLASFEGVEGIDVAAARNKRRELEKEVARLRQTERRLRWARVEQFAEAQDTLNRERLGLIGNLTPTKRSAVTGFGDAGWDQAKSELRQLTLIVRYHRFVATRWLGALREPGSGLGSTTARTIAVLLPWVLLIAVFAWWRRRAPSVLQALQERFEDHDRAARVTAPSLTLRGFRFLRALRRPLEWLLLFLGMISLLPAAAASLLEVQLITTVVGWTMAGALVVDAINAGFASTTTTAGGTLPPGSIDELRLRSLQLIGRVVVAFALILVISARLVGEGAIFSWVLSTCWLASVPILIVLVRWWRETVFVRIERMRKKSRFQIWALENQHGWKSFFAATSAALHLFVTGAVRLARAWVSTFDLARRGAAYLFRRELDKLDKERDARTYEAIPKHLFDALAPTGPAGEWVETPLDERIEKVGLRIASGQGGVVALVGERGAGKSAMLRRLLDTSASTILAQCEWGGRGLEELRARLAAAAGLPADTTLDRFGATVDTPAAPRAVILDDVHVHVRMVMGGLADFDALIAVARAHSHQSVWILSFEDTVWQFLERSRGVRPLFDEVLILEPWSEERIGTLLDTRSLEAGATPAFEDLLDDLPPQADEVDRQDALRERRRGYFRLIWDYALGNPGVALHVWRGSLGVDTEAKVHVRRLQTPNAHELELLPYPTLFVLRAVLQLAPASAEDIERATQLTPMEISDAIRYSVAHGYLEEHAGRVDLSWDWLRPITRHLQRRHLLELR